MRFARPLIAALALAAATPVLAASFDCGAARTPDEVAVCRTPALSLLDTEMGALWFSYSRIPMLMGASGVRGDDARAFLAARAHCGAETGCIAALYTARNTALRSGITAALANVTPR